MDLMRATLLLTQDEHECVKQFRNIVFNVLAHNRDDHAKNFSFLMDNTGRWRVSPAYDLTFSMGPSGEHCTTVMGEGRNPAKSHLLKLADDCKINIKIANDIIAEVQEAVKKWQNFARSAEVKTKSLNNISSSLRETLMKFLPK